MKSKFKVFDAQSNIAYLYCILSFVSDVSVPCFLPDVCECVMSHTLSSVCGSRDGRVTTRTGLIIEEICSRIL